MVVSSRGVMLIGLVGGFGSRPWPLTGHPGVKEYKEQLKKLKLGPQTYNSNALPKPLTPLGGTPLMLPLFRRIVDECNIQDIAMALMYMPEDIRQYFGPNMAPLRSGTGSSMFWEHQHMDSDPNKEINLNTAGCVIRGWQKELKGRGGPDTFIIPSADIRSNANVARMIEEHRRNNALISIALAPVAWREVSRFGVVFQEGASYDPASGKQITGSAGRYALINRFQEKNPHSKSNLNNASIYIISERLFQLIEDDIEVPENRNQLDPKAKAEYLAMNKEQRRKANPYNLPIPGIDGIPDKPYEEWRGNYLNDWTDSGRHFRLGVYSSILMKQKLLEKGRANANYQDWGGHVFPEVSQHHSEIYRASDPAIPSGFYGYTTNSLWADDGTRGAFLNANHELLLRVGGFSKQSFDWWPIAHERIERDPSGRMIWIGKNVTIEDGASIIGPAIIGDNVRIKRGSVVQFSVVGAGWTIERSFVNGSVLWPDRQQMGLTPFSPNLSYQLNGVHLEYCIMGSGFDQRASEFAEDQNGRYDTSFPFWRGANPSQITLKGKVIVSNPEKTVAVNLERKDLPHKEFIPEITTQDIIDHTKVSSRILVIDDDQIDLNTTLSKLQQNGWQQIDIARTKEEALAKTRANEYSFIICDSILSPEIPTDKRTKADGVDIVLDIKLNPNSPNYNTPIVFWSSHKSTEAMKGLDPKMTAKMVKRGVIIEEKAGDFAEHLSDLILENILGKK